MDHVGTGTERMRTSTQSSPYIARWVITDVSSLASARAC
jgi:hypothetical protein